MKIERILLRNFRGVAEHEVMPSDGVTIIEGPNEVGKSSLAEAVNLLIRYPDSSQHDEVESVRPVHTGRSPEAEIDVRAGRYRFTYRKRWSRKSDAETMLRIYEPVPETIHGRAAHERADQILRENADMELWSALRVLQSPGRKNDRAGQRTALDQPALSGKSALMRALDQAAGTETAATRDEYASTLVDAAQRELERYVTSSKRVPTGDYKRAIEDEQALRAEVHRRQDVLDSVIEDIEVHRRCELKLGGLNKAAREQAPGLVELEHEFGELEQAARDVEALEAKAAGAKAQAAAAETFAAARRSLREEAAAGAKNADELAEAARSLETHFAEKQAEADAAGTRARTAEDARSKAESDVATTAADREHLRELEELTELAWRRTQASEATEQIDQCTAALAAIQITKADLAKLDKSHDRLLQARAALEVASSLVEISAVEGAAEPVVRLDGVNAQSVVPGRFERRLIDATTLIVDEWIRVRVTPGNGEAGQRTKVGKLRKDLDTSLADLGVADMEDARAQCDRRGELERELAAARATAGAALGGQDLGTVTSRIAELTTRTQHYRAGRSADALPTDLAAVDEALRAAHETAKQLASEAEQTSVVAAAFGEAAQQAHTKALLARERAGQAHAGAERLHQKLKTARAQVPDQELEDQHRRLSEGAARAAEAWRVVADAFDPGLLENARLRLENARAVVARREEEIRQCDVDLVRLDANLARDRDAREQLDEAQVQHTAAVQKLAGFHRRAAAARLLCDTLNATRDAAKRAYVEPFRKKLEQYARIVCDEPRLELLVSDDLTITHRVLDGAAVPYEGLSGGSQEQLALCSRLACAALVDPADGVPVIIDDALGFTDPDRLGRIGAVFNVTGDRSQIIVLTCTPGRFQGIGRATVIPLQRSAAPARVAMGTSATLAAPTLIEAERGTAPRAESMQAGDAAAAVLRILREADEPLGRSDLVARAGIAVEQWQPAIRALVESGVVEQRGEKRGAKYTLVRGA